jgi:hypothetical protein
MSGQAVSVRALRGLDQGEEPGSPEHCPRRLDHAGQAAAGEGLTNTAESGSQDQRSTDQWMNC